MIIYMFIGRRDRSAYFATRAILWLNSAKWSMYPGATHKLLFQKVILNVHLFTNNIYIGNYKMSLYINLIYATIWYDNIKTIL